jgi:hypothetical protein
MQVPAKNTIEWIWRHIAISLPANWELLQFSTDFTRGRCAFADRYQFRAEMNWNIVNGEPDYDRMISDYTHRLEYEKKLTNKELIKKSGWYGFTGEVNGDRTSRFGHYLKEIGCLVECVLLWPEKREPALESSVLSTITARPADQQGRQHWRAFGLDIALPATAGLESCTAQSGRAEFTFANHKTNNAWQFARHGMVNTWLNSDLEQWLTNKLSPDARELRINRRKQRGLDMVWAEGAFKPGGMHIRNGRLEACAWICPEDGRLYHAAKRIRNSTQTEDTPLEQLLTAAPEFTPRWPS